MASLNRSSVLTPCMHFHSARSLRVQFKSRLMLKKKVQLGTVPRHSSIIAASLNPFDMLDDQIRLMERQMQSDFARMEQQINRQLDAVSEDVRQEVTVNRGNGFEAVRRVERGGHHFYSESISVSWGPHYHAAAAAPVQASSLASPFILPGILLVAGYAVLAAAFQRSFDLTLYSEGKKWQLALMWPFLILFSKTFRRQFFGALRGKKAQLPGDSELASGNGENN